MYIELIYDEGNFEGIPNVKNTMQAELKKRIHSFLPGTQVTVKPTAGFNQVNTDYNDHHRTMFISLIEDMFLDKDTWLFNKSS